MKTWIALLKLTEKGISQVSQSPKRVSAARKIAQGMGIDMVGVYWTIGSYDGVAILKAPDEQAATAFLLHLGKAGYVRSETLLAYEASEFQEVLAKMEAAG